jgi:hypothetical protein
LSDMARSGANARSAFRVLCCKASASGPTVSDLPARRSFSFCPRCPGAQSPSLRRGIRRHSNGALARGR